MTLRDQIQTVIDNEPVAVFIKGTPERPACGNSQRALQAYSDPWLGYTDIDGAGQLVAETSPFVTDLNWGDINEMADVVEANFLRKPEQRDLIAVCRLLKVGKSRPWTSVRRWRTWCGRSDQRFQESQSIAGSPRGDAERGQGQR
jgi:hypothetical protein